MARIRKNTESAKTKIIWKAALYIRLSKEDGNDVSFSVQNQKKRLMNYLSMSEDELELVDFYVDDGFTGTDSNRSDFQRMLSDIREKKVNCVIVKDPSRLSRNYIEAGHYMEQLFVNLNVRFISLELPTLDSYKMPEQMNSIIVPIQNVINDDFCRQTSIKIRGVFNMKRSNGEFIGAFAPYGYSKDPRNKSRFIVDSEAAEVVKDIFSWYVNDGLSKNGIVKKLNDLGIPNPASYKRQKGLKYQNPNTNVNDGLWSSHTITGILQNQTYLGYMVQGRYKIKSYKVHTQVKVPQEEWFVVKDTHEAIIDQETFDKAQSLQERDTRTAPNKKELYLFSGFIRCADCKKAMTRRTSKNNVYYACRTYAQKSKEKCTKHSIKLELLENAVLTAIQKQISLVGTLAEIIEAINNAPIVHNESKRLSHMLRLREQEFTKTKDTIDSLYMDWKNGDITREEYRRLKNKFEEHAQQLEQVIKNLTEENQIMANGIGSDDPYLINFLKYKNITALNRGILVELVKTIYVHDKGELTIEFNFADHHKRIVEFIENNQRELKIITNKAN